MTTELPSTRWDRRTFRLALALGMGVLSAACATGTSLGAGLDDGSLPDTDGGQGDGSHVVVVNDAGKGDTSATACGTGFMVCAGACVSSTSPLHCGSCDNVCPSGDSCSNNECVAGGTSGTGSGGGGGGDSSTGTDGGGSDGGSDDSGTCPTGDTMCGSICTNTQTDPDNCGMCNNPCTSDTCVSGSCASSGDDGGSDDSGGGGNGYSCSHSPCSTGAALQNNCDDGENYDDLVSAVCEDIPSCCTSGWTNDCVDDMEEYCECPIFGSACVDPGCQ